MSRTKEVYMEIEHYYEIAISSVSANSFNRFVEFHQYGGPKEYARQVAKGMSSDEFIEWWMSGRGHEIGMMGPSQREFILEVASRAEGAGSSPA